MITITPDAATAIKGIVDSTELDSGGLRIFAQPTTDSQASLELEVAGGPAPGDEVVDAQGATVFLESSAAAFLDDKVLDAAQEGEEVHFRIAEQESPQA